MTERTWPIGSLDRSPPEGQRHYKRNRRTILFSFRVTEAEAQMLAEAAEAEYRTPSDVVRARVFGPFAPLTGRDA